MKQLLLILLALLPFAIYGQETNEKILYIVDSIPIFEDISEEEGTLSEDIIESINVVTNKDDFGYYKIFEFNKLIFIFTKEYAKRPEEIKRIPSFKKMYEKEGRWCMKGSPSPYSGPVIDYYYTGIKKQDLILKDGVKEGSCNSYYKDGKLKFSLSYSNGKENGESVNYFPSGQVQLKGSYKNGKEEGIWQEWYSTGTLKREIFYKAGKSKPSKEDSKVYSLVKKGIDSFYKKNFDEAVTYYNEALKLKPNNSDLYFYRGRAYFFSHSFENAIADFDKVIEIEPYYKDAYSHRAFTRIRKYELTNQKTEIEIAIFEQTGIANIPPSEKEKVCFDLKKSIELGENMKLIVDALKIYCE